MDAKELKEKIDAVVVNYNQKVKGAKFGVVSLMNDINDLIEFNGAFHILKGGEKPLIYELFYLNSILKWNKTNQDKISLIDTYFNEEIYKFSMSQNIFNSIPKSKLADIKKINFKSYEPTDKSMKDLTSVFCGTDNLRPVLMGVNYNSLGVIATDSNKLIFLSKKDDKLKKDVTKCITDSCVKEYKYGDITKSNFPNWQLVVPTKDSAPFNFIFDVDALIRYLTICLNFGLFYKAEDTAIVTFDFIKNYESDNSIFSFNLEYFLDCLKALSKLGITKAKINYSKPNKGIVLNNAEVVEKDFLNQDFVMLMPVMIVDERKTFYFDFKTNSVVYGENKYEFPIGIEENVTKELNHFEHKEIKNNITLEQLSKHPKIKDKLSKLSDSELKKSIKGGCSTNYNIGTKTYNCEYNIFETETKINADKKEFLSISYKIEIFKGTSTKNQDSYYDAERRVLEYFGRIKGELNEEETPAESKSNLEYLEDLLSVSKDLLDLISDTGSEKDINYLKDKIEATEILISLLADDKFSKGGGVSEKEIPRVPKTYELELDYKVGQWFKEDIVGGTADCYITSIDFQVDEINGLPVVHPNSYRIEYKNTTYGSTHQVHFNFIKNLKKEKNKIKIEVPYSIGGGIFFESSKYDNQIKLLNGKVDSFKVLYYGTRNDWFSYYVDLNGKTYTIDSKDAYSSIDNYISRVSKDGFVEKKLETFKEPIGGELKVKLDYKIGQKIKVPVMGGFEESEITGITIGVNAEDGKIVKDNHNSTISYKNVYGGREDNSEIYADFEKKEYANKIENEIIIDIKGLYLEKYITLHRYMGGSKLNVNNVRGYKFIIDKNGIKIGYIDNDIDFEIFTSINDFREKISLLSIDEKKKFELGGIFHGSSYHFDRFLTSKMGSGIGQQDDGWGLYLTTDKDGAKNYGKYIYETTLFKGKKPNEYNFLELKKPVPKDLVEKIVEAVYKYYNKEFDINKFNSYYDYVKNESLPKVDFNDFELIRFDYGGYLFYKTLSRTLGGDKKASLFLLDNGIDGLKSSLVEYGVHYRTDYVIFDENAITIEKTEYLPHHYYAGGGGVKKQKLSAENKALIKKLIKGIPKSTYNDFDDNELPYELLVYADKNNDFEVTQYVKFKNITELDKVFDEIIIKHKNKLLRIEFRWSEYYGYPDSIEIYNAQEFDEDEAPKFKDDGQARPFTDDGNKYVVFNEFRNYNPYKIAVNDVNNADYITLWKTDMETGKDKKVGALKLNETSYNYRDGFLSVSEISIDRGSKGLGLGLEMYKVALKYSSDKIKGIKSYLPNRTNKKQIPKIYKKLNSVQDGDYEFIYKEHNPNIKFNDGGSVELNNLFNENELINLIKMCDFKTADVSNLERITYSKSENPFKLNDNLWIKISPKDDWYGSLIIVIEKVKNHYEIRIGEDTGWTGGIEIDSTEFAFDIPKLTFEEFKKGFLNATINQNYCLYSKKSDKIHLIGSLQEIKDYALQNGYELYEYGNKIVNFFLVSKNLSKYNDERTLIVKVLSSEQIQNLQSNYGNSSGGYNELKNYLHNIRLDEYYMENEIMDDDDDIEQYKADFGRKGKITYRVYPDKKGNVNSSIYIYSIDRGTLDDDLVQSIEGKKDSRGEGAKAIASLFLLYPNVNSVHYLDESYFDNEDNGFWQKIGGSSDELLRSDFFTYFENKFGNNPDIRYAGGGGVKNTNEIKGSYVWEYALDYGSENHSESENPIFDAKEQILETNYVERELLIPNLIKNDVDLKDFFDSEKQDNFSSYKKGKLVNKNIIIGDSNYSEDVVIDGYHRIVQSIVNGENTIKAFVPTTSMYYSNNPDIRYAGGGGVFLAPNGKPSNLTPEQYKLVRTNEFKAWFGDWENDSENASKVIDENGEPNPQYHFTDNKFTKFKFKESGFHFGDKSIRDDLSIAKGQSLSIEINAFLNIKNPLRIDDMSRFTPDKVTEKLLDKGIISDEKANELQQIYYELDDDEDSVTKQSNKLIKAINDLGYDGFIYENKFDSQDSKISYLIDDSSSKIYVRNDLGVFKGDVVLLSDYDRKPFLVFTDLNGNEYAVDDNEGEELTSVDKIRIKNMLNLGYYISVVNSPKTYKDYDLFLSDKLFLDSWIAFYPNQIKLADGKNTTFDSNNPDIRFDEGGGVKQPKDISRIPNFENISKGAEYFSTSQDVEKKQKSDRWCELLLINKKGIQLNKNEFNEFIELSNELYLEHFDTREPNTYTEFFNRLKIEDGTKYIGQKFGDVFPYLKGSFLTPFKYKLKVKQYNDCLKRLSEDNYTTKAMKQADLNKIENNKGKINKVKYLSEFVCDNTGTIIDFKHNPDIQFVNGGSVSKSRFYATEKVDNWSDIPSTWKNTNKVNKMNLKLDTNDDNFNDTFKNFLSKDELRPVMMGYNVDENGITCTNGHILAVIPTKEKLKKGIFINGKEIDGKYPNYNAVIPKDNFKSISRIDCYKLLQYCNVALNYSDKSNFGCNFNTENGIIKFNLKLLITLMETSLKLGYEELYFKFKELDNAVLISNVKDPILGKDIIFLIFPMSNRGYEFKGTQDIDYNLELSCYFDFPKNEIINKNNSIVDFQIEYGLNPVFTKEIIDVVKLNLGKKNFIPIVENILVENKEIRIVNFDNLYTTIIKDVDAPNGLYYIKNNVAVLNVNSNALDFPKKSIFYKENPKPINKISIDLEYFKWILDILKIHKSIDKFKENLMGLNINYNGDKLLFVTTDGNSLGIIDANGYFSIDNKNDFNNIIGFGEISNSLNLENNGDIIIEFYEDGNFRILGNKIEFSGQTISGNKPNYQSVLPKECSNKLTINYKKIVSALSTKEVQSFVKKSKASKGYSVVKVLGKEENNKLVVSLILTENNFSSKVTDKVLDSKVIYTDDLIYDTDANVKITDSCLLLMPMLFNEPHLFCFQLSLFNRLIKPINTENFDLLFNNNSGKPYIINSNNFNYTKKISKKDISKPKEVKTILVKPKKEITNKKQSDLEYLKELLSVSKDLLDLISDTGSEKDINYIKDKIEATEILISLMK